MTMRYIITRQVASRGTVRTFWLLDTQTGKVLGVFEDAEPCPLRRSGAWAAVQYEQTRLAREE
jgi:hypothetical protein